MVTTDEVRLRDAHHTIGAQDMTIRLLEAKIARLEAERDAFRSTVSNELAKLEVLSSRDCREDVDAVVDDVIGGLGDGLYPESAKAKSTAHVCPMAIKCPDGLPVCATCKAVA
jgi:hypothetical protein